MDWNLELGTTCRAYIWGTFDLVVFKIISGSFGAIVSRWSVTQKWLAVEWNGSIFGTCGVPYNIILYTCIRYLWPQCSRSLSWHSVHFSQMVCISKTAGRGAKEIWDPGILERHIHDIRGTFNLGVFKVTLRSVSVHVWIWPLTQKKKKYDSVERNRLKLGLKDISIA